MGLHGAIRGKPVRITVLDKAAPRQVFEALRRPVDDLAGDLTREMTTVRKGVEAAFEEFEKFQRPPDYGPELGRIVKQAAVAG